MALGRPRGFDTDEALDRALLVFWEKGYEGASIADLTKAMGINPPSLYAAFGNKEALFKRALERYEQKRDGAIEAAFSARSARDAVAALLGDTVTKLADKSMPKGCLMVQAALAGGEDCEDLKCLLAERRDAGEALIREHLKRAKRRGELASSADPAALASFIATVMQGMAVKASAGASRKELRDVADMALRAFPEAAE